MIKTYLFAAVAAITLSSCGGNKVTVNDETITLEDGIYAKLETTMGDILIDFHEDLARFKYIMRLLRRYRETGLIQERLVLNHIISIYNVFDMKAATRMMFYRIDDELWPALKTFLIYLNYLPTSQYKNITIDINIANKLKNL